VCVRERESIVFFYPFVPLNLFYMICRHHHTLSSLH
jgi:hypothetical protein